MSARGSRMERSVLLVTSNFEEAPWNINPPKADLGQKATDGLHYPIGLAYLHSYLESRGNTVHTLCLNNYGQEDCFSRVVREVDSFSPKVVGLQILTANRVSSYRIIEYLHEKHPEIQIIIGGIHATVMHEQLIQRYPFLIAVLGEGEVTASELVEYAHGARSDLMSIDGIAYNDHGTVVRTRPRELIRDLDILPFPKHELFFTGNRKIGSILTTRGCPFRCSFCVLDVISRRIHRKRSVKNVVDEVEHLVTSFPQMEQIQIHDDSFFLDNERVMQFCDEIVRRKIKIEFIASGRMKPLSKGLIRRLEHANFKTILLGLESGNEAILKSCHKAITRKDVINAFELFSDSSIEIFTFLIVGLPGETMETILDTARFVQTLQKIDYVYFKDVGILMVYPGTEVYSIAKSRGRIDDEFWLSNDPTPLYTVDYDLRTLYHLKDVLLDRISIDRIVTASGLRAQYRMLPYIFKFLVRRKRYRRTLVWLICQEMRRKAHMVLSQVQRRLNKHKRTGSAGKICDRAHSVTLLHLGKSLAAR